MKDFHELRFQKMSSGPQWIPDTWMHTDLSLQYKD